MKRQLFKNVSVVVTPSGKVVDREGFLSAILAVSVGEVTGTPDKVTLSVKLEHADTKDGEFKEVPDTMLNPEQATVQGGIPDREIESGQELAIDIDLLGCKKFIKVTPTITFKGGTTPAAAGAGYAMVLGDPSESPV